MIERWDAGDAGCGSLVMGLRQRVLRLEPAARLEVVARDPGAERDLEAWCRMTGNRLVSAEHPVYLIERRSE